MKKTLLSLFIVFAFIACKKTEYEPIGPTDVRIYNKTDTVFTDVLVNTSGGEFNYGTIEPKSYSEYHRFEKSYPKVDISLKINEVQFASENQDYTYYNYLGQVKCTYRIYINKTNGLVEMELVYEAPLDGK